jgi:hypothetical protein
MSAGPTERKELSSWKEVASHLGVSVRTAQLWERDKGLPVRRLPGEKGRIWADSAELDRWRQDHLVGKPRWWSSPRFLRLWAATATGALLVAATLYLAPTPNGPPADFHHAGKSLVVTDGQGRELWRKTFVETFHSEATPEKILELKRAWFGDLDGDGRVEFLYSFTPSTQEADGNILFCFSDSGREKWRFVPGRAVSTRVAAFPKTYRVARLAPFPPERDGTRRIAVSSQHRPRYMGQLAVLSHQGVVRGEYWHSGHLGPIELADLNGDGSLEMLVGGISNGYGAATLVVLDPNNLGGASREEDLDYQLLGFGPGREKARLLFPRTCINRKFHRYGNPVFLGVQGDSVRVQVHERAVGGDPTVHYVFDRRLELKQVVVSDGLKYLHRELEAAGQLDHPLTDKEVSELRQIRYLKRLGP